MKNALIIHTLLILLFQQTIAQNLVINPSFEIGAVCDGSTERIDSVDTWLNIAGSPGFINTNCILSQESKSFVQGMRLPPAAHKNVLCIIKMDKLGEFIGGQLQAPLIQEKTYVVNMFVRRPIKFCTRPLKSVGILFSEEPLQMSIEKRVIDKPALALFNNNQSLIEAQYEWEEISAIYRANGGEQYLTIGNFSTINENILKDSSEKACSYMFIDYVSVKAFEEISLEIFNSEKAIKKGKRLLLSNVEFEMGKDVLIKKAIEELNALAGLLLENPNMKVEITSHCDNSLEASKGLTCTKARAQKILNILTEKQVPASQLDIKGKGSMDAISLNNSAKGREKNNRVELKVLQL